MKKKICFQQMTLDQLDIHVQNKQIHKKEPQIRGSRLIQKLSPNGF